MRLEILGVKTNNENRIKKGDAMNYREMIAELLKKTDNERFLRAIYISVRDCVREQGNTGQYNEAGSEGSA